MQLRVHAGVNHINFLGKAQSFGALHQFYDRHSFSIFHSSNRHSNNRTGHTVAISKLSTVEPLYFPANSGSLVDTVSFFNFDNYSVSGTGYYRLKQYLNLGIGAAVMYENYRQRDEAITGLSGADFSFYKHQLSASLNYNKVENVFERLEGTTGKIYGEWINTYSPNTPSFLKLLFKFTWNKLISENGNFSARTKFGVSANNFSPFAPFGIDGFLNVRGIGKRVDRRTASFILNTEYRQSFWNHKYFTLQTAAFVDYGTLRSPGDNYDRYFP